MSVIVTVHVSGDPATFEQQVAAHADAIGRIMDVAKRHGLVAHRWYSADGQYMAIDEWPDADSFNAFFDEAQPDIGPVMQAASVTSPPDVTFWRTLDTGDAVGCGGLTEPGCAHNDPAERARGTCADPTSRTFPGDKTRS
jgi:hypothetical protein